MEPKKHPPELSATFAAEAEWNAWMSLKERLQQLHAELEFLRLMLKLRLPG